jgi:predicted transcriptional regulator of viral defense system
MEEISVIKTIEDLKNEYKAYSDILGKLKREVALGKYIPIVRGLYETSKNTPGYLLSSYIYGPSYLSFEYALSYYGMIPEKVSTYTSASFNKHKTKKYITPFGNYIYKDIPKLAFSHDVIAIEENGYVYHIATKEKALCDKLYDIKPVSGLKALKELLFDDLRIDESLFSSLDKNKLANLISKYKSKNLSLLHKMLMEDE